MMRALLISLAALLSIAVLSTGASARTADNGGFGLGENIEKQPCRAVERLEGDQSDVGVDIYCGA